MSVDATHDPALRSWVPGADGHGEFPIQNLPLGVFSPLAGAPRGGVAIGEHVLDLRACHEQGVFTGSAAEAAGVASGGTLNGLLAMGSAARGALRKQVQALLREGAAARPELLHQVADCMMYVPARIGDYTDFYAGIHHAMNVGRLFRPDASLMPNYKWVPIGYHGRASSVGVGGEVRRPNGQRKRPDEAAPSFGPCRNLDYELELGMWIGPGNALGAAVPIGEAGAHIAGYCLLNDWSARDIQGWEYQPLGPFLAKSFCTTVSPWIVTAEALAPFRVAQAGRPEGDPRPLGYLWDEGNQASGALEVELEVFLMTAAMREAGRAPYRLSAGTARDLYWTPEQLVAHHTSNGCNLQAGDLMGSGTISGPAPGQYGSLLEITEGGRRPVPVEGETRRFLEDGDEVIVRGRARREGFATIGFGECRGRVLPAV